MSSLWSKFLPCLMLSACEGPTPEPPEPAAPISVGGDPIDTALVADVASARGLGILDAARAVARDALFAKSVEASDAPLAAQLRRIALARALSEHLVERARSSGPPTEQELARFTDRHWWDLDRPAMSRVTHALVRVKDERDRERARRVAEKLRDALRGIAEEKRFREVAEGHDGEGFEVRVEAVLPVTEDGRAADPEQPPTPGARVSRYALPFAQAAAALTELGSQSGLVETKFGFHVMLLTERIPELRSSREARSRMLFTEIVSARAHDAERALVDRAKAETKPQVEVAAVAQMEGFSGVR